MSATPRAVVANVGSTAGSRTAMASATLAEPMQGLMSPPSPTPEFDPEPELEPDSAVAEARSPSIADALGEPADSARNVVSPPTYLEIEETPMALPIALGAAGALVGALVWACIAHATGMEIGYVAWLLGGLVGGGCVLGGGRGPVLAAAAALLAFVGIAGGRLYGTQLLIDEQVDVVIGMFDRDAFQQLKNAAQEHAAVGLPSMPVGEAGVDEDGIEWTEEELQAAALAQERMFAQLREPGYTFEHWREEQAAVMHGELALFDVVKETMGLIDILFVLLGVSTAFGMVRRASVSS